MSDSNEIIDSLKEKIRSVISMYENAVERVELLESELDSLRNKLEMHEKKMKDLTHEKETNKMAEAFLAGGGNSQEARLKINNIVREIDKCIALLNK